MTRSLRFKMLFFGTVLVLVPFALSEFLGIDLNPVQTLINLSYTFGLASIALALYMIYIRGKPKR
jgi:hypothetical protein